MSNRRAQDERIEGTPDGVNAISEIVDVPDAPTIGTATAGLGNASVAFTPATTGGTASTYTAISNPGSFTGTSATSPITVSGLTGGTAYTFTVRGSNSTGTGPSSSASNSVTPVDLPGSYDALADITVPSGGATSITFAGIPSGYKHLQLRWLVRSTATGGDSASTLRMKLNSSAGTYRSHGLLGIGSNPALAGDNGSNSTGDWIYYAIPNDSVTASMFGVGVIDVLDYTNTSKNTVSRMLAGFDKNGGGQVGLQSHLWVDTSAVTQIDFSLGTGNFAQFSQFALYGVK